MISSEHWEVEWIVAALAPWTVSPHPNFRQDGVSSATGLALVTEMRDERESRSPRAFEDSAFDWRGQLIENARGSLNVETQADSSKVLMELSAQHEVSPGARAAAALFASVALCELERHGEAVGVLERILEVFTDGCRRDPNEYAPSQRLIIAVLHMQISARLVESCNFDKAKISVTRTLEWLPRLKDSKWQQFTVSKGISWGPTTVQRDLVRSITNHALALKGYLEQISGHTWVRVVRSRTSWVDMRMHLRSADRDEVVLRDAFERRIEATSNTRHFGRITAEQAGYRSLTLAELSGHMGYMREEREKLGKVLILERNDSQERMRESLRLLRQGHATKALQAAISWIRAQGPTQPLIDDALAIIERVNKANWCTEQDLLVLEGASDFLTPTQKDEAISASLLFAETPRLQGQMSWSSWERLWKTISKLVPESSSHDVVASLACSYVSTREELSQPITNTLTRLIYALDWSEIDNETTCQWAEWIKSAERNVDTNVLLDALEEMASGVGQRIPNQIGLDRAAHFADEGLPAEASKDDILQITDYLLDKLREEAVEASNGRVSIGGYQSAHVAVAFGLRFPDDGLWTQTVDYLINPKIDAAMKDLALERLAENVELLPQPVVSSLCENIEILVGSKRRDTLFSPTGVSIFGEAIRLAAALKAVPKEDILDTILRLASSNVKDRIQAAKTIPFAITEADATWGHALLLQLSHDSDPSVRAAAGHALVRSLVAASDLTEAVYSRIIVLLKSDGIKIPLALLHGVQRSALKLREQLEPLVKHLTVLASEQPSYITKGAAQVCLQKLNVTT